MIHTFGDSHCEFGFKDIPNVSIHPIPGARLCYTFGNKPFDVLNIKNYNVQDNDTVIFSFGEPDCRAHIYRYVNEHTTYQEIINNITSKYFEAIKKNIEQYNNLKTCVYNIVPPSDVLLKHSSEEYISKILVKCKTDIHWKGSNEDRKQYHVYFNKRLKELCHQYGYTFFDVYDKYCDANGFLKRELSDYNIHIDNAIYIKEFLITNKILFIS